MPLRDDHDAALARADALQAELDRERSAHAQQGARVAQLEAELREARARLERAEETLGDLKPKRPEPAPAPAPRSGSLGVLAVGIVVVIAAVGVCLQTRAREVTRVPERVAPTGPFVANRLVAEGLARVEADLLVRKIAVDYVGGDGILDPTHGRVTIETRRPPAPRPADDPSRPTGAPPPTEPMVDMMMANCPSQYWSPRLGWDAQQGSCLGFRDAPVGRPRCTVGAILARARQDGAPAGLARISVEWTFIVGSSRLEDGWKWSFAISDSARGVSFTRDYVDGDCPAESP